VTLIAERHREILVRYQGREATVELKADLPVTFGVEQIEIGVIK
jgi:hypothetical protein